MSLDVNVNGTFNLLQESATNGVSAFVNASTGGALFGDAPQLPVSEKSVPKPISPYGASKLATEGFCSSFNACFTGLNTISLRFSNVYGPGSSHKTTAIASFLSSIVSGNRIVVYGDGTQRRDFVYIDDICSAIIKAMNCSERLGGGCIQLGSGTATSIESLLSTIGEVLGRGDLGSIIDYKNFRIGEVKDVSVDISRARATIDYSPTWELESGISETYAYFRGLT